MPIKTFTTPCFGGPMHLMAVGNETGTLQFCCEDYPVGWEPGDCSIAGATPMREEWYFLQPILFGWPSGIVWAYYYWCYSELQGDSLVLDQISLASMYVERFDRSELPVEQEAHKPQPAAAVYDYGYGLKVGRN